ncbi:MAG TPA: alpha/beta hydrolase, partial [Pirellulales bacterium]
RDVQFDSEGLTCSGWYYVPGDYRPGERRAAVVMAHGWGGVKEMSLPNFAQAFAAAGLVVLAFDYRFLGASQGQPRQQVIPRQQRLDYRNAITWVSSQPEVDAERIGIWGTSYSGGHVLAVAAEDRRVKVVVAHVPAIDHRDTVLRWLRDGLVKQVLQGAGLIARQLLQPHRAVTAPIINTPGRFATLPGDEAYRWSTRAAASASSWRNEVTVRSMLAATRINLRRYVPRIAPTPLLMMIGNRDTYCFSDVQRQAFESAGEPKKLLQADGGHFDFYDEPGLSHVLPEETEWFCRHLSVPTRVGS